MSIFSSIGAKCSDGKLEMPIFKNSTMYSKSRDLESYLRVSSALMRFQRCLQSSSPRANLPATVFQFGRALLSCFSSRSLARSSGVHSRGTARSGGEREREMFLASAALSRWLPEERRRRSATGLGAAQIGDLDRAEFGIGTFHASGAVQCRTGGGKLALAMR